MTSHPAAGREAMIRHPAAHRLALLSGEDVTIRLDDPPSPVPQPFAALLLELRANRDNLTVAASASCRWLFPGRGPGSRSDTRRCGGG
ncbi:hypothetical protein [Micromonospora polyrhachis]|uniref:Uncharacterized protein n=1 Tax=Micromonospora polyrhachis TaxID=1282883 RepID=A0A7W7WML9_9ACTN|nr:hypothetical protein [Micromonospora polyrhachis]MBB4956599.1 hypothetical protein [Micromonospora polyrhachis]